jgi:hypothetical protein
VAHKAADLLQILLQIVPAAAADSAEPVAAVGGGAASQAAAQAGRQELPVGVLLGGAVAHHVPWAPTLEAQACGEGWWWRVGAGGQRGGRPHSVSERLQRVYVQYRGLTHNTLFCLHWEQVVVAL